MNYDDIDNTFEDDADIDVEVEEDVEPENIRKFDPDVVRAELQVQFELNEDFLTEHTKGIDELSQTVTLLQVALEKLQAFRKANDDYEWVNENFSQQEYRIGSTYEHLKDELETRKQAQVEDTITFARRGLDGLNSGKLHVDGSYYNCWYGCTHIPGKSASSTANAVRRAMRERGLLPKGWDSSFTPIERWGINGPDIVSSFLKEELPNFIKKHS